jgi:hypothetical protein
MDWLNHLIWLVVGVIGVTAVIKSITLAGRGGNARQRGDTGSRTVRPVGEAPRPGATETGPMVYYANDRHGRPDKEYRFNYKLVGGSWRAYILRMPDLAGRNGGGSVTHRLYDGGSPYICWDSAVTSLKDMQTISRVWADNIQEYIATGRTFG